MAATERAYLAAFFRAIDQAIVAKVSSRRNSTVAQAYAPFTAWEEDLLFLSCLLRSRSSSIS